MKITVVITTWQIPFAQVVKEIMTFGPNKYAVEAARDYVNSEVHKWYEDANGVDDDTKSAETIEGLNRHTDGTFELGYHNAEYQLWGGECGFHAMLDAASAAVLDEAHYKREYDDKGLTRPGYLINAYLDGGKELTEAERDKYERQQAAGIAAIEAAYSNPKQ